MTHGPHGYGPVEDVRFVHRNVFKAGDGCSDDTLVLLHRVIDVQNEACKRATWYAARGCVAFLVLQFGSAWSWWRLGTAKRGGGKLQTDAYGTRGNVRVLRAASVVVLRSGWLSPITQNAMQTAKQEQNSRQENGDSFVLLLCCVFASVWQPLVAKRSPL